MDIRRFINNNNVRYHLFIVCVTLIYSLVATLAEFHDSPYGSAGDLMVLAAQAGVVACGTYGLMMLLAINRWVFAVAFPVIMLASGVLAYFRYTAGITLTPMIIELCMVNDTGMAATLVSGTLVLSVCGSLLVAVAVVWVRFRLVRRPSVIPNAAAAVAIVAVLNLTPRLAAPVAARMPYSFYYCTSDYLRQRKVVAAVRPELAGQTVCRTDTMTVILVIGESLRADHVQLNGYHRPTTPGLASDTSVVSLPHVYTREIFTHTSVPDMLTRADAAHPERAYEERSFISLFEKAGFRTSWLTNQDAVRNYVYFMNECDTIVYANGGKSVYVFDKWMDTDLLPALDAELGRGDPLKLVVMHTIGSHWWYESHYDDRYRRFEPVIDSRIVSSCTDEALVNSYDNTVVATDDFLMSVLGRLRDRRALVIYLSDHGESLGEDGYYLHGADHWTLHWPACMVWMSDSYKSDFPSEAAALRANAGRRHTTDFLFHSILPGAGIEHPSITDSLNIFAYGHE